MTTTVNQLARAFGVVVRQIADLLMMLQDYHALVPNLTRVLDISTTEVLELQVSEFWRNATYFVVNLAQALYMRDDRIQQGHYNFIHRDETTMHSLCKRKLQLFGRVWRLPSDQVASDCPGETI